MTTTPTTPRALLDSAISEKAFQAQVIQLAELNGWRVYHTFDSRRSASGFPDLVMMRDGRMVVAELKSEKGRYRPAQQGWLNAFQALANAADDPRRLVQVYTWRPRHWSVIERVLASTPPEQPTPRRKGADDA